MIAARMRPHTMYKNAQTCARLIKVNNLEEAGVSKVLPQLQQVNCRRERAREATESDANRKIGGRGTCWRHRFRMSLKILLIYHCKKSSTYWARDPARPWSKSSEKFKSAHAHAMRFFILWISLHVFLMHIQDQQVDVHLSACVCVGMCLSSCMCVCTNKSFVHTTCTKLVQARLPFPQRHITESSLPNVGMFMEMWMVCVCVCIWELSVQ